MANKWRTIRFYKAKGFARKINPTVEEDPTQPTTTEERVNLEGFFRKIQELEFKYNSDRSNIVEIDGKFLALEFIEYLGDGIYCQFRKVISGPIIRYTNENKEELELELGENDLGYESAVLVYIPSVEIIALESTNNVSHNKGLEQYFTAILSKYGSLNFDLDRIALDEQTGIFSRVTQASGIARNVNIKFKAQNAAKVESEGQIGNIVRSYGNFDNGDTICEVNLKRERTKGGARPVFNNTEIMEFWEKDGHLLEGFDINVGSRDWIPLGREISARPFQAIKNGRLIEGRDLAEKIIGFTGAPR